jgi:hypothetical protein
MAIVRIEFCSAIRFLLIVHENIQTTSSLNLNKKKVKFLLASGLLRVLVQGEGGKEYNM